jgi:uncharacterized protein YjbJ (UPF0337 family)
MSNTSKRIEGVAAQWGGKVKRLGAFLDDRGLQARGAAEEVAGQARQAAS